MQVNELSVDEKLSDPNDAASLQEEAFRLAAIALAQRACAPESHRDFDGSHCVDCGDEIPEARLKMKKVYCVHCQTYFERTGKRG